MPRSTEEPLAQLLTVLQRCLGKPGLIGDTDFRVPDRERWIVVQILGPGARVESREILAICIVDDIASAVRFGHDC